MITMTNRFKITFVIITIVLMCIANSSIAMNKERSEERANKRSFSTHSQTQLREKIKFKITGSLDAVYDGRIVVDDTSYYLQNNIGTTQVSRGDYVGIQLNSDNKVKLIKCIPSPD